MELPSGRDAGDGLGGVQRKSKTDALGRLTQVVENPSAANPQDRTTTYTYRDNGNLYTKTDADSVVVTSAWDQLNRLKGKSYSSGAGTPAVTYCYDGDTSGACAGAPSGSPGNLTMVTNGSYTTRYTVYDGLRRVTASSQQFSSETPYTFSYGYNMAGGLELETFPSNRHVRTCYDKAGRPKQVTNPDNSLNYANNVQYAAHGAMTSAQLGNGLTESWGYTRMQPTTMSAGSLLSMTMNYGLSVNNGNLLSRTIDDGTVFSQSFGYTDGLNRLTTFSESGTGLYQTYEYDRWGNRAVTASSLPLTGLTPQALTAYNTNTNRWTGTGVVHDNRGNQTALPSRTFAYDAESRLKTATYLAETTGYDYDGEGRRVKKTVNGVETRFVYDALGRLAAEYTTAAPTSPCATCYLIADHLGSTRLVTGPTGAVVKRYDYVPFGEEIPAGQFNRGTLNSSATYPAPADSATAIKFTGKLRDAETGLDYFLARYYSSAQGRFTSPDEFTGGIVDAYTGGQVQQPGPLPYADITDPQTLNKYAYVRANPLRYVDPEGHCPWCIGAIYGAGTNIGAEILVDLAAGQPITWRKTLAAGLSGAIVGGTAGAASGLGLAVQIAIAGDAGVIGGIAERAIVSGSLSEAMKNPTKMGLDFASNALGHGIVKTAEGTVKEVSGGTVESLSEQLTRARTPSRQTKIRGRLDAATQVLERQQKAASTALEVARETASRKPRRSQVCTPAASCEE